MNAFRNTVKFSQEDSFDVISCCKTEIFLEFPGAFVRISMYVYVYSIIARIRFQSAAGNLVKKWECRDFAEGISFTTTQFNI